MTALLFGWLGISLIGAGLIAGALLAAWLGIRWLAFGLAVAAAAYIYSGILYQEGQWACEKRVREAVAIEVARQQVAIDRADKLAAELAIARAEINRLIDEQQAAAEAEIEQEAADEEAAQATQVPVDGVCAPCRCTDGERDIRRLYELLGQP